MKKVLWDIGIGLLIGGVLGMVIDFFLSRIPSVEFWILLVAFSVGAMMMITSHFWYSIVGILKLQVKELICWYIEREEPEHHGWEHCHEYNFSGEVTINARTKTTVKEFYLELAGKDQKIRVDNQTIPFDALVPLDVFQILPDEPITQSYFFQVRLDNQIEVPPKGDIILKSEHGKSRYKVSIIRDDNYRPIPSCFTREG